MLWLFATICLALNQPFFDAVFVFLGSTALVAFILWTVSVYELKMEYVFNKDFHLEGFIVGVDRFIINLSLVVFLASIPPERADNMRIEGGLFTLLIGLVFMVIGTVVVLTTPNKKDYRRTNFEEDNVGKESVVDLAQDDDRQNDFDHLRESLKQAKEDTLVVLPEDTKQEQDGI